ncbi:hypothetical protein V1512DRAFT_265230 [Lipomyces arxii]|uniref:uncharacterized protein n=1 Tax=Lipomyces arxii TaxID=56418 RepID=UPI0034CD6C37
MSYLSPALPRGLQAVIPVDPPPSKREKVAKYLQQKKLQFDQYQQLLNQQRQQLMNQRQKELLGASRRNSSAGGSSAKFYRLLSSTSFTSFAKAQQNTQYAESSISEATTAVEDDKSSKVKLLNDKDGEKLVMFPSYARRLKNGLVEVDIRGWVFAPGAPNRKNRLFTSVVRQLVGVEQPEADADYATSGTLKPTDARYDPEQKRSSISLRKNTSSISVSSVLTSGRGSPSPSRRGSTVAYPNGRFRNESSSSSTAAMNIPAKSERISPSGNSQSSRQQSRSYSPAPGTPTNAAFALGTSPRRDTYSSAAQQARRPGVMTDDASGAIVSKSFVQPTLVGERQPLLASSPGARSNKGYLIDFSSESGSDYASESDDDEVVDNHHQTLVVERKNSMARSFNSQRAAFKNSVSPSNNIRAQQSFYAQNFNGSAISIAGHNSEVVAANSVNAPLSSSVNANMGSYFPPLGRSNSGLSLSRAFSFSGPPSPSLPISRGKEQQKSQATSPAPPALPSRPNLTRFASMYDAEKAMQERIAPFISRPMAQEVITIHVGSTETEEYSTYNVITTDSGHFGVRLRLNYMPAIACVEVGEDLIAVEEVKVIEPYGVSLISDIDDTVKHTGITGAKKGIFRNVFVKDYAELEIKGVAEWFQRVNKMGVPIHYVSNSPWQLFPSIQKFLRKAGLPSGSMHLKHYNGFLYGLLEPAVEKKRFNLESILVDFPERKFILVGDSGEMDLEAYVNLACQFPDQVLAIYIRDVTTMCSDDDDFCTVSQFNGFFSTSVPRPDEIDDLLTNETNWCCSPCAPTDPDRYYNRPHSPPPLMPKPQGLRGQKVMTEAPGPTNTQWNSSTSLDQQNGDTPQIPRKPISLKGQSVSSNGSPIYNPSAMAANYDMLSSSAGSTVSPLAARLAAFSSTFNNESVSPEPPGYMSIKYQAQQLNNKEPASHVLTSNGNGLSKQSSHANLQNYSSIPTSAPSPQRNVKFSETEANKKPVLPPRPGHIIQDAAASAAGAAYTATRGNKPSPYEIASLAYRAAGGKETEYNPPIDKKLQLWKKRVARARMMLPNGVKLRMWRIGQDVSDECESIVQEYLDKMEDEMGSY